MEIRYEDRKCALIIFSLIISIVFIGYVIIGFQILKM